MSLERNEEGLILDNGQVRECDLNIVKMGFWRTWKHFYGYRRAARVLDSAGRDFAEALATLAGVILGVVLFPLIPFTQAFYAWRRAIREARETDQ